jgi:hypothetical protein
MTYRWLVVLALGVSACSGNSPAGPSTVPPPPAANLTSDGQGTWVNCLPAVGSFPGACQFKGDARNSGLGCATAVRGTIQFFDTANVQRGPSSEWTLASSRIVRAGETFSYTATSQELSVVNVTRTYNLQFAWTNVACP